jgi:uncharacterized SAM-binding protein YcdF (DUF218 family)
MIRLRHNQRGGVISSLISLLFLVVLLGALYAARHPILRYIGESLVVEDPLQKSDAIVILSDDNFYADRATRAAELFRQGLAPIVVASGVRLRPSASIAELMTHDLIERGVPKENIRPFPQDADNTREEAEALKKLSQDNRWKSLTVVTSNYHTRRARYIFQKVFRNAAIIHVASARDGDYDPQNWYKHRKAIKRFTHEAAGFLPAWWELRHPAQP